MTVGTEYSGSDGPDELDFWSEFGLFLAADGRKVDSETERNDWALEHDHNNNFPLQGEGAVRPEVGDDN
jgi:hypothetical protein